MELTCEQRINDYMQSRLETIDAYQQHNDKASDELGLDADVDDNDLADACDEALGCMPLSVESFKVYKITLGTGGPGDWFEVMCSGYPMLSENYTGRDFTIERIVYHFNDWFDHAERHLPAGSDEYAIAEQFVSRFIEELY